MVIFQWKKELETGLNLIDDQHRELFQVINSFFISYKCGGSCAQTQKCLDFLQHYVMYHFQAEESFQVECGYPQYLQHKALHDSLATKVKFFSVRLSSSQFAPEIVSEFSEFLYAYLKTHILEEDLSFAEYYKEWKSSNQKAKAPEAG